MLVVLLLLCVVKMLEVLELYCSGELVVVLFLVCVVVLFGLMVDDCVIDIVYELDEEECVWLILLLGIDVCQVIQKLLSYLLNIVGVLMIIEYVVVFVSWIVVQILQYICQVECICEMVYVIYVLELVSQQLQQVVIMCWLIIGLFEELILDVVQVNLLVMVDVLMDQEEVVCLICCYDLLVILVVDVQQQMFGIVIVDDVFDVLIEELIEDVYKFGGMEVLDKFYMQIGFFEMLCKCVGWLSVLFLGEMLMVSVMQYYEDELVCVVVLILFILLIMSLGGNLGLQVILLLICSLVLCELCLCDWWRVVICEILIGMVLGVIFGCLVIVCIVIWQLGGLYDYGEYWILLVIIIGVVLVGIVIFGLLFGLMLFFVLKWFGFDLVSVLVLFVVILVDVIGLVIYFSIVVLILYGMLL